MFENVACIMAVIYSRPQHVNSWHMSSWHWVNISLVNGLVQDRCPAITWTMSTYLKLGSQEQTSVKFQLRCIFIWKNKQCVLKSYLQNNNVIIKRKYFQCYWPFVRGIHWWLMESSHKDQWRGALIFFICTGTKGWTNNQDASDLRHHCTHYDITVMC